MTPRRVHRPYVVAEEGDHLFIWLGLDEADLEKGILTNQYMVLDGSNAMLIDPRGYYVFERVYNAVTEFVKPENVVAVFYSHQDPDVVGSLNLVVDYFPQRQGLRVRALDKIPTTPGHGNRPRHSRDTRQ